MKNWMEDKLDQIQYDIKTSKLVLQQGLIDVGTNMKKGFLELILENTKNMKDDAESELELLQLETKLLLETIGDQETVLDAKKGIIFELLNKFDIEVIIIGLLLVL